MIFNTQIVKQGASGSPFIYGAIVETKRASTTITSATREYIKPTAAKTRDTSNGVEVDLYTATTSSGNTYSPSISSVELLGCNLPDGEYLIEVAMVGASIPSQGIYGGMRLTYSNGQVTNVIKQTSLRVIGSVTSYTKFLCMLTSLTYTPPS